MNYALSEEVLNQILEYLKKCPYHEVAPIIDAIKASAKSVNLITPEPIVKGGDGENVLSSQTESQVETQSSQEGGIQSVQEEPQTAREG